MTQRFIIRLLDAADRLLAWAEILATAKPQERPAASCPFWASGPTQFVVEAAGTASKVTVHWVDLDVARVQDILELLPVEPGQQVTFSWMEPVWLVAGTRNVPLPAVTVKQPVKVAVPVGALAAETHR